MFFRFYQFLGNYAAWTVTDWVGMLAIVLVAGILIRFSPTLLRYALAPFVAVEAYLLTPFFACAGLDFMFNRAAGTSMACSSTEYANYVSRNFGVDHWYIIVTYAIVLGFLTYNFWRSFAYRMGWKGIVTKGQRRAMDDQAASEEVSRDRIRQMESIRRIGE